MAYHCVINHENECDGCGSCKEQIPKCPICGQECDSFYKHGTEILGCDNCIRKVDSYNED